MGKQITRRAYKGWNREVSVAPGARESEQLDSGVSDHSVHRRQVGRTGLPRFTHVGSRKPRHRMFGEKNIQSLVDERGGKIGLRRSAMSQRGKCSRGLPQLLCPGPQDSPGSPQHADLCPLCRLMLPKFFLDGLCLPGPQL